MDQAGGLGDGPDVDGVVADRLVGAQRDRDAVVEQCPPGCHSAAEPQIADGVVHDGGSGFGDRVEVGVVDPDGVDHVGVRLEKTCVGGELDE